MSSDSYDLVKRYVGSIVGSALEETLYNTFYTLYRPGRCIFKYKSVEFGIIFNDGSIILSIDRLQFMECVKKMTGEDYLVKSTVEISFADPNFENKLIEHLDHYVDTCRALFL